MSNDAVHSPVKGVLVTGVWVRKDFGHLGGQIEVLVEVDGKWCSLDTWKNDDGCISHIFETAGILKAAQRSR